MERSCIDCPAKISRQNRTGRCRPCALVAMNRDPVARARRVAALMAGLATPEGREKRLAGLQRFNSNLPPEEIERRRVHGRHIAATVLNRPDVRAKSNAPDVRRRANVSRVEVMLGWCPAAYRDQHRRNVTSKRMSAAESRRAIETEIAEVAAADQARRDEARRAGGPRMTFEEQLARVRAGATLVPKIALRRPDPAFTLGGVGSAAL